MFRASWLLNVANPFHCFICRILILNHDLPTTRLAERNFSLCSVFVQSFDRTVNAYNEMLIVFVLLLTFFTGYDSLLANLPDLILDTPEAPTMLGNFIARSVADDCIPPKYVTNPDNVDELNEYALAALKRADALLSLKQGWAHLDNIWGKAGPLRPVKIITKQMTLLLKEYLSSRDFNEASRCLRALEVPHYHHELVYEAILMALESVNSQTEEAMCNLLKAMDEACLILPAQMEQVSYLQFPPLFSAFLKLFS